VTAPYAHVGGQRVIAATVHVPQFGPWWADLTFEDDAPDVAGEVTFVIGELELVGTVDTTHDGTHGRQRHTRIVAGAGAWGRLVAARGYHNDAGVRARVVVDDLVALVGEELDTAFAPVAERVGIDFVRQAGPASRALEDAIGGARWWVGYDGVTRVGERSTSTPEAGSYEVLEHAPDERVVVLAIDDLRTVGIGSVLTERLDTPQTVRGLEIRLTADDVRVRAWCGGEASTGDRIADLVRRIVERVSDGRLWGLWRYRVVRMSSDRVELQAVRAAAGLPDIAPISMWCGVAGAHAELAQGAEVLVQFVEGLRSMPVITHYAGKDGVGWTPTNVVLTASSTLKLAATTAADGVAKSSSCDDLFDKIAGALDALCSTAPVSNDGGAALQAAVRLAWAPDQPGAAGVPPVITPPADVGSDKVFVP
jgi:hypothetical protein